MNESGKPIWMRMICDSTSATRPTAIAVMPYCTAITLWSWLYQYFVTQLCGS